MRSVADISRGSQTDIEPKRFQCGCFAVGVGLADARCACREAPVLTALLSVALLAGECEMPSAQSAAMPDMPGLPEVGVESSAEVLEMRQLQ